MQCFIFVLLILGAGGATAPPLDPVELVIQDILGGRDTKLSNVVGVPTVKDYTIRVYQ